MDKKGRKEFKDKNYNGRKKDHHQRKNKKKNITKPVYKPNRKENQKPGRVTLTPQGPKKRATSQKHKQPKTQLRGKRI